MGKAVLAAGKEPCYVCSGTGCWKDGAGDTYECGICKGTGVRDKRKPCRPKWPGLFIRTDFSK